MDIVSCILTLSVFVNLLFYFKGLNNAQDHTSFLSHAHVHLRFEINYYFEIWNSSPTN